MEQATKKQLLTNGLTVPDDGCLVVATDRGYWGRGKTLREALSNLRSTSGMWLLYIINGDTESYVDEDGFLKRKVGSKVDAMYRAEK